MVDLHMPIMFPGDVQEALDLARHAVALSRASGMWVGSSSSRPVADGTGTVDVHPDRVVPVVPDDGVRGQALRPAPERAAARRPYTLDMEREFHEVRSELARQYGVVNRLNRVTGRAPSDDWIGIAACGQTYHELREALALLGFADDESLRRAGIRLLLLSMPVPLDDDDVREFAHGLREVLVVEEKNPTLELLVKSALYTWNERPQIVGRLDERGAPLVPGPECSTPTRSPAALRRAPRCRHRRSTGLRPLPAVRERSRIPLAVNRTPFYCSGCPHNISHAGPRRHAGRRRHRVPRDGRPDGAGPRRRHRRAHRDGQRGRAVDRHGAVHRARPPRAEPRRRHVLPLRLAGHPGRASRPASTSRTSCSTTAPSR